MDNMYDKVGRIQGLLCDERELEINENEWLTLD